ncbi:hypothetical protein ACHAWF_016745 [Thalassiosira exigua]
MRTQAYFYGPEDATYYRLQNVQNIPKRRKDTYERVFKQLHGTIMNAGNKYIQSYIRVKDYVERHLKNKVWDVKLSLHANESADQRIHSGRLNAPAVKKISILLSNDITANHDQQVVINYMKDDNQSRRRIISDFQKACDPLQYPLLFLIGQDGWHHYLKHTALQHVNCILMDRKGIVNPILCGNSLGQQYMVNQWLKVELKRLRWVKDNQKTLRAEVYSGLRDAKKSDNGAATLQNTGKRVVLLLSSFADGDRYMHQQLMDALALYPRFGWSHIFSTMATNPDWPEIKQHLKPGQTALDRPDLVARVSKLKKQELIRDVMKNHIIGKTIARAHIIEFQKRGFPHAHIVFWLVPETGKHMNPDRLDEILCAEIPDKEANPVLFELVTKFMLHGPCGPEYPDRACMQGGDGFCRFNFPKDFVLVTQLSDDGYQLHRRRSPEEGDHTFETWKNKEKVYLFKYFHNVNDQSTDRVEKAPDKNGVDSNDGGLPENDVLEYQIKRYVSGVEAMWRLRRNELASRKPAICRLLVHLLDQQIVYYDPSKYDESIDDTERSSRTMLTAYFELNNDKEDEKYAHQFLYRQVPEHYRWDQERRHGSREREFVMTSPK